MQVNRVARTAESNQGVTNTEETTEQENQTTSETTEGGFDVFLRAILTPDKANNVSEEELFAALIQERINTLHGDEAANEFASLFAAQKTAHRTADGYVPYEDCAKYALREMRDKGTVTSEEADKIYSESFAAAQLDGDATALFDGRGGAGDATVAVKQLEEALIAARLKIDNFTAGSETAAGRSLDEASNQKLSQAGSILTGNSHGSSTGAGNPGTSGFDAEVQGSEPDTALARSPNGTTFDGANGFLFKPISENQGKLAILLPESMAYKVAGVLLRDADGNVVDEGHSTGYGDLGTREKFSFSRQGGQYGKNVTVEIRMMDGTSSRYFIPNPALRYD